ncbi:hypothetical protein ACIRD3_12780 [Kitasatospora sp. NPDC093550]|uniref:hypothetical protein n=1 Tax=Kitasatospora sp. NPDC093550 TaxID=3364089 RepID=UPI003807B882
MDLETLLRRLADEYIEDPWDRPEEYHHAGDATLPGLPPGSHPVHIGAEIIDNAAVGAEEAFVVLLLVQLGPPERIAEAEFVTAAPHWQALSADLGLLWDAATMEHRTGPGRHQRVWLARQVTPTISLPALPTFAENAVCREGRTADGALVALLFTRSQQPF